MNHAGSVDEAIKILESNDLHSSLGIVIHFAISDKSGKSVVVEYVNNKMVVIDTPVVTNFYFDKINKAGISGDKVCERYATLMSAIDGKKLSEDDVRDALDSVSMHNYEFTNGSTTEWSIVFNQSTLEAHYYHREDYTKQYDFKLK